MLTTSLDGLWVLQVLTGIEVLAPEMGLRPHLPSVEPKHKALDHPVAAELRAAGAIDETDSVDGTIVEWLTVLSRRDIALLVHFRLPNDDETTRALLARFAHWWVAIERSGDLVRISGAGITSNEGTATAALNSQIERLCGAIDPAPLRPVTLDADAMRAAATDEGSLHEFLGKQGLDADQVHLLKLATDPARSAQASIVAMQSGVDSGGPTRTYIEPGAVTIIDTPEGRLVAEHVSSGAKKWMIIAPGTKNNIGSAINHMVRRLPADQEWHSYRKVV
ncbi:ESX secretion-associated protein EspG [Mycobacterium montefiorense]|uniref:ESX-2 secretion-associated protein EspG2 n=1 Tax=Mycobacterium montefiorense TaxID=154654 RepID=A0AA37PKX7_9MYCO|nr:ESX secretion-associated protein EspG [Mycobacterium montefiorense]GBG41001.1 ESX-2 secretion-associated protein EspG2 [Mycobacterium montefiorense]GKU35087.1 ESX-2 secretion-associated protein EspG2 [Mycobacterium montefiorense]GKU41228.1 ESX-2 secretion-associated protein EspG2 [Mycobacterium montefiorense]GKU47849.1 ESX-2 secretion-associated protein EspG2 [Mycobacterium montefiorense]GKU49505.1 ESX-2 secretion-associated protein EspG2 [Mycobacterium montefiorense]